MKVKKTVLAQLNKCYAVAPLFYQGKRQFLVAAEKADLVYAYGPHSDRVVIGAITGGINNKATARFDTHEEMAATLRRTAKPGDTLLFKGSRGMKMEQVLKMFLEGK